MYKYLITFDDTDNLESLGTGHLLDNFKSSISDIAESSYISRHQLFVHKDVPFTSHNSSMCTELTTNVEIDEIIKLAAKFLENNCAEGSDPGLCVVDKNKLIYPEELMKFGYNAKKQILTKDDAYSLAKKLNMHLSEHGGTGQGVVGALAAIGLRLSGNDGRIKGKKQLDENIKALTVKELLEKTGFEQVCCLGDGVLSDDKPISLHQNIVKAVYLGWKSTVIVKKINNSYELLSKDKLKCF